MNGDDLTKEGLLSRFLQLEQRVEELEQELAQKNKRIEEQNEQIDELREVPEPTPTTLNGDDWPRAISGSPETLAALLEQLAERVGVDEVMIQHIHAIHDDALRSHELIAEGMGLT